MAKIGRNQLCPCTSGRKYKLCCGSANNTPKRLPASLEITRALEAHYAKERIRQEQQGLGRPIIAGRLNDHQIVAVGNTVHWSAKAKTFPDFLGEYIKRVLGSDWGNAELAKPFDQRHTLLQWYDAYCRYQAATIKTPGEMSTAEVTGVVACYLGTAYSLYVLDHNVELQTRLVRRLKNPRDFQGAYYELIVANALIRAGFKLTLEDETDRSAKHCEFAAVSQRTGKKYWVEAKMRAVVGLLGKDDNDGTRNPNPISQMIPHLNGALAKPAADDRLIFIDPNTDAALGADGKPTWTQSSFARLQQFERRELVAGVAAYVFISNVPFHRMLSDRLHTALAAFGLGMPDFNRPGSYRLSERYRQERTHSDAFHIAEAFAKYPQLPTTFDDSLPSDNLEGKLRVVIGETYLFEDVANLPGSLGGNLVATVTTASVLEPEKTAYICVTDQNGHSHILTEPMTDQQLADYKAHPEAYFGKIQHVGKKINSKYELFEFFMESYESIDRATLLERLTTHPNTASFAGMSDDDILAEYCEGMVAASSMFRNP
jgi:SEC-C motif